MSSPPPFFPPLMVAGASISFAHLEPFQFTVCTQDRPNGAVIDVRFSNHCFSETYDAQRHLDPVDVWDGQKRRAFDEARYRFSFSLPAIVAALPTSPIYLTPEANFVRIVAPDAAGNDREYRVFFNAKRGGGISGIDMSLFVESAYAPDPGRALQPRQMTKVRFALLVDKIVRGERPRFQYKR